MDKKIEANAIKSRDLLMVRIIQGATKAGVAMDRKKQANKHACRGKVRDE